MKLQNSYFNNLKPHQYKQQVEKDWGFWRPIVEGIASYTEVSNMTQHELAMLNAAIDIQIRKTNGKGGK